MWTPSVSSVNHHFTCYWSRRNSRRALDAQGNGNSPDYWLWQRCSDLSATKAIVAWDGEGRTLWGNSWSLPAAPSEIPPRSCCHSAIEKNSKRAHLLLYHLPRTYTIFVIENRELYLCGGVERIRKEGRNASGWFHVCHVPRSFTVKHGYQMSRFWNGCEPATRYVVIHTSHTRTYFEYLHKSFPRSLSNLGTARVFTGEMSKFRNDHRPNETTIIP